MLLDKMPPRHLRYGSSLPLPEIYGSLLNTCSPVTLQDVGHSDEARELLVGLLVGNLKSSVCPT